jgi:hypothetical protein
VPGRAVVELESAVDDDGGGAEVVERGRVTGAAAVDDDDGGGAEVGKRGGGCRAGQSRSSSRLWTMTGAAWRS